MLCHLASWGVAQNLEGLGLFVYLNTVPIHVGDVIFYPMDLNPASGVANLSIIVTVFLFIVFLTSIRGCFYLNKWFGFVGVLLWLIPGFFSILGYMPDIRGMGPDMFRFGVGFPGGMESAAANLFICLVGGWSFILLLSSRWKKNTFKNVYDHIWYTLGLIAGLYFVVDAGLPSYKESLLDADERMVRTMQLFRSSEEHLKVLCPLPEVLKLSPALCALAPELKWSVSSYLDMGGALRAKIAPPDWITTLASDPLLARQIEALNNWACDQGRQPAQCQTVPPDTTLLVQDVDIPLAFPTPNYAELVLKLHSSMEQTDSRINTIKQGHNLRYFGFLIVAVLAGGKLAGASRALVSADLVKPQSWIFTAIKYVALKLMTLLKFLVKLSAYVYRFFSQYAVLLVVRYRRGKVSHREQRRKVTLEQK